MILKNNEDKRLIIYNDTLDKPQLPKVQIKGYDHSYIYRQTIYGNGWFNRFQKNKRKSVAIINQNYNDFDLMFIPNAAFAKNIINKPFNTLEDAMFEVEQLMR